MSDFAQFPRPVKGCRAEYGSGKTRLIVDACQLSDDLYEVITMRPRGEEVELVRVATEAEARAVYAQMADRYAHVAETAMTPAMLRLVAALKSAAEAGRAALTGEDGGACNFDSPALSLPHMTEKQVKACAKAAGTTVFVWRLYSQRLLGFNVPVAGPQGNDRTRQAEAMTASLAAAGYDALTYSQMD
jgi:hypothetical protein